MSERPGYLPALAGLRFIAALHVVLFHVRDLYFANAPQPLLLVLGRGPFAVLLFFVLSGFVLGHIYLPSARNPRISWRTFWIARFARLYPVYLLSLGLALPFFIATLLRHTDPAVAGSRALGGILVIPMLQSWLPETANLWNSPAWSLSVEAFFYALFPFIAAATAGLSPRRLGVVLTCCLILPVLTHVASGLVWPSVPLGQFGNNLTATNPLIHLPIFCVGVLVARLYRDRAARASASPAWSVVAILAAALSTLLVITHPNALNRLGGGAIVPLFGILVYSLACGGRGLAWVLSLPPIVFLGEASYALYLLHVPVYEVVTALITRLAPPGLDDHQPIFLGIYLLACIAAATAIHVVVERPARRYIVRALGQRGRTQYVQMHERVAY